MAGRDLRRQEQELDAGLALKGKSGDVFDKLGNEGVLHKIEETKKQNGAEQAPTSLLDLASKDVEQKQAKPAVMAPAEAAKEAVAPPEEKKKEEEVVAKEVVAEEEQAAKKKPVGAEVLPAGAAAEVEKQAEKGKKPPTVDEAAKKLEQEKLAAEEAKKSEAEDPLKKAAEAKKSSGMQAREKVTALLQQLMSNPIELQVLATATDPSQKAVQIVEYVAQYLGDRDLGALAAFGHDDLVGAMVVGPEARQQVRVLSPQATQMGAFAPILTQLVIDELSRQPAVSAKNDEQQEVGAQQQDPRRLAPVLNRISSRLRTASA